MQQPVKGHPCHVTSITVSPAHVSLSGSRGRGGGVTAQTPPPQVTLPRAHLLSGASSPRHGGRVASSIRRKINSLLSGRHRLRPSSPLLLPQRHRAQPCSPRHGWAEDGQLVTPPAASHGEVRQGQGAAARLAPGTGQGCQRRGCGAAVPAGHRHSLGKAAGSSIMSGSDKGAQLGRPGRSDKGPVIFVLREREKKIKRKKERKSTLCFSSRPPSPSLRCG